MKTPSNLRDPADKLGAVVGFIMGVVLVILVLIRDPFTHLMLNGINIPDSPFTKLVIYILLVGVCVNLTRNLAVGMHDTFVFFHHVFVKRFTKNK